MTISLIAAVTENGVIGRDNGLPWRLSTDLKRFKQLTMGHHMLMGRKTFDSIGAKALPGRRIVVISRSAGDDIEGVRFATSVGEALAMTGDDPEVFIAGGGMIFEETIARADRLYLTRIHAVIEGDAYFPEVDSTLWAVREREDVEADEKNEYPFSFLTYERSGLVRQPTDEVSG